MAESTLAALLEPVSADDPCGPDLGLHNDFVVVQQLAEELMVAIADGTDADAERWRALSMQSVSLLRRTKDVWLVVWLTKGLTRLHGFAGLREGLWLLREMLQRYWEPLYPRSDDGEYPQRVNAISELNSPRFLKLVRRAVVSQSGPLGTITVRDLQLASGDLSIPAGSEDQKPDPGALEAALRAARDREGDAMRARFDSIQAALQSIDAITELQRGHMPPADVAELSDLRALLGRAATFMAPLVQGSVTPAVAVGGNGAADAKAGQGEAPARELPAEQWVIRSREDVVKAFDRISEFYEKNIPESPIPLILGRVRGLVHKGFLDAMKDLAPDSVPEVLKLAGTTDRQE